jgi:hypothetical protein
MQSVLTGIWIGLFYDDSIEAKSGNRLDLKFRTFFYLKPKMAKVGVVTIGLLKCRRWKYFSMVNTLIEK